MFRIIHGNRLEGLADRLLAARGVEVIAVLLTERLMGTAPGASPTGAVTFCGIGSLRGIPFRVVCLIGMADTARYGRHRVSTPASP